MKWILVFYLMNPQDYKIHTGYIHQENCIKAQERYQSIFAQTGSTMHAECRKENLVQRNQPTTVTYSKHTIY